MADVSVLRSCWHSLSSSVGYCTCLSLFYFEFNDMYRISAPFPHWQSRFSFLSFSPLFRNFFFFSAVSSCRRETSVLSSAGEFSQLGENESRRGRKRRHEMRNAIQYRGEITTSGPRGYRKHKGTRMCLSP